MPPPPKGLPLVDVPATVAATLDVKFEAVAAAEAAGAIARQDFRNACEDALRNVGADLTGVTIAGVETGPERFAVAVRDASPLQRSSGPLLH